MRRGLPAAPLVEEHDAVHLGVEVPACTTDISRATASPPVSAAAPCSSLPPSAAPLLLLLPHRRMSPLVPPPGPPCRKTTGLPFGLPSATTADQRTNRQSGSSSQPPPSHSRHGRTAFLVIQFVRVRHFEAASPAVTHDGLVNQTADGGLATPSTETKTRVNSLVGLDRRPVVPGPGVRAPDRPQLPLGRGSGCSARAGLVSCHAKETVRPPSPACPHGHPNFNLPSQSVLALLVAKSAQAAAATAPAPTGARRDPDTTRSAAGGKAYLFIQLPSPCSPLTLKTGIAGT